LQGRPQFGSEAQLASKRDTQIGINPSLENDTDVIPVSPSEAASANRQKVIEGYVELFRKNSQSV
jgi:hypothetical protein